MGLSYTKAELEAAYKDGYNHSNEEAAGWLERLTVPLLRSSIQQALVIGIRALAKKDEKPKPAPAPTSRTNFQCDCAATSCHGWSTTECGCSCHGPIHGYR